VSERAVLSPPGDRPGSRAGRPHRAVGSAWISSRVNLGMM